MRYIILSALSLSLLSACGIRVPDIKVCAVAGMTSAGADCVHTLSEDRETMNLDQLLEFLEPQEERADPADPEPDPAKKRKLPARGPAVLIPSADFAKLKTFIQQACRMMGNTCSYTIKKKIQSATDRVEGISASSMAKKAKKPEAAGAVQGQPSP